MLHLDPLPGDPMWKYGMNMEDVVEDARKDLVILHFFHQTHHFFARRFSLRSRKLHKKARKKTGGAGGEEVAVVGGVHYLGVGAEGATLKLVKEKSSTKNVVPLGSATSPSEDSFQFN